MTTLYIFVTIIQSMAISLGVGSSTLAILNFFAAIKDGLIDESERNLMGIVYIVLRVAMVLILVTTAVQALLVYSDVGVGYFTTLALAAWTLTAVLFINAFLMTKRIMPSTFGPAIQAGSWYTFGLVAALISVQRTEFVYWQFLLGYLTMVTLAVAIVNAAMAYSKPRKERVGD